MGFSKTKVAVSGNKCPNLLKKRKALHFYPVNRQNYTWISDSKKLLSFSRFIVIRIIEP